jgi:hypothetical protein
MRFDLDTVVGEIALGCTASEDSRFVVQQSKKGVGRQDYQCFNA